MNLILFDFHNQFTESVMPVSTVFMDLEISLRRETDAEILWSLAGKKLFVC